VVRVTGQGSKRVSVAALIATRRGDRSRLIYRMHLDRGSGRRRRPGLIDGFLAKTGLDPTPDL
jgi:hypothetical protein